MKSNVVSEVCQFCGDKKAEKYADACLACIIDSMQDPEN